MKTNVQLLEILDGEVFGHQAAKKALITLVARAQRNYVDEHAFGKSRKELSSPMRLLLIGESGTGKTFLVETLRNELGFPYFYVDATKLNPTGNSTGITETALRKSILAYADALVKEQGSKFKSREGVLAQLVVFVDEFDKLGNSFEASGKWNSHVQSNFLTLIDDKHEMSRVSWVFAGAFTDTREKRIKKHMLGFTGEESTALATKEITDDELLKSGIIPEMLGRITKIVELDVFAEGDYVTLITERLLPAKLAEADNMGTDGRNVEVDINKLAKDAAGSGMGVRHAQRSLDTLFEFLEWEVDFDRSMCHI